MHTHAATKEMKNKSFAVKIKDIKEAIEIQVTLISENKDQKKYFLKSKYNHFFRKVCVHFEPLLGWESAQVCHSLRSEKEDI